MFDRKLNIPFWDTDIVYDETVLMVRENGCAMSTLLYPPIKVLSVTDTKKTIEYEEGRDWTVSGNKIMLPEGSRIFCYDHDVLYPAEKPEKDSVMKSVNGYALFSEGTFFIEKQIAVTYTCEKGQWTGVKPVLADKVLPRTFAKLRAGEPFSLVLNGDSISEGACASGRVGIAPNTPDYGEMLSIVLRDRYGDNIKYTNTSLACTTIGWGLENLGTNVLPHDPDLVIIAFGMNDASTSPEDFEASARSMIKGIRDKRPECEFILVSTTVPNVLIPGFVGNQWKFTTPIKNIAADTPGVAVADMTSVHCELLERKKFIDMTSNNVNHPNDFLLRCYTQFLSGMLID